VNRIKGEGLSGNDLATMELRMLCPVTWKTLEVAFAHKLFADLLTGEYRIRRAPTRRSGASRVSTK
jgi:hypothetical protein